MRWKFTEFTLTSQYCTYFLFNLPEEFCIYCWPWHILNERCLTEPLTLLFLPHKNDSFRTKITFFTTPLFYDDTKSFLLMYSYLPFFRSLLLYSLFLDGFYSFCFLANLSSFLVLKSIVILEHIILHWQNSIALAMQIYWHIFNGIL